MAKYKPLDKTVEIIETNPHLSNCFRFNMFSEQIEFNKKPEWDLSIEPGDNIHDLHISSLRYYLSRIHDFEPAKGIVGEACYLVSKKSAYHPIKRYIEKEEWDGINRIDTWLHKTVMCEDNVYTRDVSKKILIAIVNRVYNPGCKFDHMLILEGDQGIGKSTMIEVLAGDFYIDISFENKDKDLVDAMSRSMIVEISELSGMSKKDVDWMKSFITRKVDRVRLPYTQYVKDFKRKSVLFGTYNPSGNNTYLRDDTGNRRFWPIECRGIDIGYLKENRTQIWAEAYEMYKKKELYHIVDKESLGILANVHSDREFNGPAYQPIENLLLKYPRDSIDMETLIHEGLKINLDNKSLNERSSIFTIVGIIMRKLRWRKGSGRNRHVYYPPDGYYKNKESVEELEWSE